MLFQQHCQKVIPWDTPGSCPTPSCPRLWTSPRWSWTSRNHCKYLFSWGLTTFVSTTLPKSHSLNKLKSVWRRRGRRVLGSLRPALRLVKNYFKVWSEVNWNLKQWFLSIFNPNFKVFYVTYLRSLECPNYGNKATFVPWPQKVSIVKVLRFGYSKSLK